MSTEKSPVKPDKNTKQLEKLLAKYHQFKSEEDRHRQLGITLAAEEAALVPKIDLSNSDQFNQLSHLRLKRDMVPIKVRDFGAAAAKALEELDAECGRLIAEHRAAVDARLAEVTAMIANAIAPYFGPDLEFVNDACRTVQERETGRISASRVAQRIAANSAAGRPLANQKEWLKNGNFLSYSPDRNARELIRLIEEFKAVKLTV